MFLYLQHISIETRPARFPTESVHENHSYLRELTSTYSALTLVPMLEHDTAHRPQFLKHTGSPLKLSTANCIIPPPLSSHPQTSPSLCVFSGSTGSCLLCPLCTLLASLTSYHILWNYNSFIYEVASPQNQG